MTPPPAIAQNTPCEQGDRAIGVARVVEIDTTNGPLFGAATHFTREPSFLRPKEVILTFDDGPVPWITRSIIATLARHCTRASFFPVGRMALAYPAVVRELLDHGHTIGSHTWSHPNSLPRLKQASATLEIDKGFAAIALAAGRPIAPFFRFPGLNDSPHLLDHVAKRGAATFSVDVVSEDSYHDDADAIVRLTLDRVEQSNGGILLFHDIKPATAKALPEILDKLKHRGFRVVHVVARAPYRVPQSFEAELKPRLGKAVRDEDASSTSDTLSGLAHPLDALKSKVPFFGAIPPVVIDNPGLPVTTLTPERRQHLKRTNKAGGLRSNPQHGASDGAATSGPSIAASRTDQTVRPQP